MKKLKIITSLSAMAALSTCVSACSYVNKANVEANAEVVSIDNLGWITKTVVTTKATTNIKYTVIGDNGIIFSKYRDLKESVDVVVTATSDTTFNISISVKSSASAKYTGGPITWVATYASPSPSPEPEPTPVPLITGTYATLAALKSSNSLVAGQRYRLTDYECTVRGTSSGDPYYNKARAVPSESQLKFDIILTATDTSTFSDNVYIDANESSRLDINFKAWTVKYCFENNTNLYQWATTSVKGIIHYIQDEFNNTCYYDFKNIQFKAYDQTDNIYRYTFSNGATSQANEADASIFLAATGTNVLVHDNIINPYFDNDDTKMLSTTFILNNVVFIGAGYLGNGLYGNTISANVHDLVAGKECRCITVGADSHNIKLGNLCSDISIGEGCSYLSLGVTSDGKLYNGSSTQYILNNTFGTGCSYIDVVFTSQVTGYNFKSNTFYATSGTSSSHKIFDQETYGTGDGYIGHLWNNNQEGGGGGGGGDPLYQHTYNIYASKEKFFETFIILNVICKVATKVEDDDYDALANFLLDLYGYDEYIQCTGTAHYLGTWPVPVYDDVAELWSPISALIIPEGYRYTLICFVRELGISCPIVEYEEMECSIRGTVVQIN